MFRDSVPHGCLQPAEYSLPFIAGASFRRSLASAPLTSDVLYLHREGARGASACNSLPPPPPSAPPCAFARARSMRHATVIFRRNPRRSKPCHVPRIIDRREGKKRRRDRNGRTSIFDVSGPAVTSRHNSNPLFSQNRETLFLGL